MVEVKESEDHMILRVYHQLDNMVYAYDGRSNEPLRIGKFEDVIEAILDDVCPATEYFVQGLARPISKEQFVQRWYFDHQVRNRTKEQPCQTKPATP
jgi:hypothetical protein